VVADLGAEHGAEDDDFVGVHRQPRRRWRGCGAATDDVRLLRSALSSSDADGQSWSTLLETRAPVTTTDAATLAKVRLGYQQTSGGPTTAQYLNDLGGSVSLSGTADDNSATERAPKLWRVAKPARSSTVQILQAGQPTLFKVKSFEWFVREHGRV
jgi:hypothetical protein